MRKEIHKHALRHQRIVSEYFCAFFSLVCYWFSAMVEYIFVFVCNMFAATPIGSAVMLVEFS